LVAISAVFMTIGLWCLTTVENNNISCYVTAVNLLAEETGVPGEDHRPAKSQLPTLSHDVVSSTPRLSGTRIMTITDLQTINRTSKAVEHVRWLSCVKGDTVDMAGNTNFQLELLQVVLRIRRMSFFEHDALRKSYVFGSSCTMREYPQRGTKLP
jgi:flavin-binding protein dodecin